MRKGMLVLSAVFAVVVLMWIAAALPALAAPALGITPTPTPGIPSPGPYEIPEPVTLALMGAGLAGLVGYTRSRRK